MNREWPRLALTGSIICLFGWALITHWSTGLEETLKNIVLLAVGFWLGSSKGDETKTENTARAFEAITATANANTTEPNVMLKPGETAQAEESKDG